MKPVLTLLVSLCCVAACYPQEKMNIYEGYQDHKRVEITSYLVEGGGNGIAVIVCPGGSYFWHDMRHEGSEVGRWLQANGINAFVLRYRAGGISAFITHNRYLSRGNRYPDPQDDLRQAIRFVKGHAEEWGIDTARIGAMGFSAGGHLVMSSTYLFDSGDRPAFVASIYPVVSFTESYSHKRSRRGLLGDDQQHDSLMCDSLSLERHIKSDCPPVFLVNCKDDPIVDYRNSEKLDSALSSADVNHLYLQYPIGGHGFGASDSKGSAVSRQWKNRFLRWIRTIF